MTKVLLIEDDKTIADIIQYYLLRNNYEVTLAKDAGEAVSASRTRFDIILLDVMLPDVNGIELCQELRRWNYCPIIYISCIDDDETIIKALERGGDDYIVKPFSNEVLRARIEANLRRVQLDKKQEPKRELKCKGFSLLTESHTVKRTDGVSYRLAPTEYRILLFLMTHPRQHYGADELYEADMEPAFNRGFSNRCGACI